MRSFSIRHQLDYDPKAESAELFFQTVQNKKRHFAEAIGHARAAEKAAKNVRRRNGDT